MVRLKDLRSESRNYPSSINLFPNRRNRMIKLKKRLVVLKALSFRRPLSFTEAFERVRGDISKPIFAKHLAACVSKGLVSKNGKYQITALGSERIFTIQKDIVGITTAHSLIEDSSKPYDPVFWHYNKPDQQDGVVEIGSIALRNSDPTTEEQRYREEAAKLFQQLEKTIKESYIRFGNCTLDLSFTIGPTSSRNKPDYKF